MTTFTKPAEAIASYTGSECWSFRLNSFDIRCFYARRELAIERISILVVLVQGSRVILLPLFFMETLCS